jgi:hypothetical protein
MAPLRALQSSLTTHQQRKIKDLAIYSERG